MQAKPPRPVLNRKHPLARGLEVAWPGLVYGASFGSLLSLGRHAAHTAVANLSGATVRAFGKAFTCGTALSATGYYYSGTFDTRNLSPSSVFVAFTQEGAAAVNGHIAGRWLQGGAQDCVFFNVGGVLYFYYNQGGTLYRVTGPSLAQGGSYSCVGVKRAASAFCIVNGVRYSTSASVGSSSATGGYFSVGGNTGSPSFAAYISVADARHWSRDLTEAEAQSLVVDPWALYRPARATVGKFGTANVTFPPWLPMLLRRRAA